MKRKMKSDMQEALKGRGMEGMSKVVLLLLVVMTFSGNYHGDRGSMPGPASSRNPAPNPSS